MPAIVKSGFLLESGARAGRANPFATLLLAAVGHFLILVGECFAAEIVWTNTAGGNWNTAANWSPNVVPTAADNAWITDNDTFKPQSE